MCANLGSHFSTCWVCLAPQNRSSPSPSLQEILKYLWRVKAPEEKGLEGILPWILHIHLHSSKGGLHHLRPNPGQASSLVAMESMPGTGIMIVEVLRTSCPDWRTCGSGSPFWATPRASFCSPSHGLLFLSPGGHHGGIDQPLHQVAQPPLQVVSFWRQALLVGECDT